MDGAASDVRAASQQDAAAAVELGHQSENTNEPPASSSKKEAPACTSSNAGTASAASAAARPGDDDDNHLSDAAPAAAGEEQEGAGDGVPLVPPEDRVVAVTPDRGVLKLLLREGYGDTPPPFARTLVHYTGRLVDSGEVFMDSKAESATHQPASLVAGRSSQPRESGLSLALATMRNGERAAIYIQDTKYGFGQQGSFSFPAVPPNARLVYDVELVQWEEPAPDEGDGPDRRRGLLYEERLEQAERRRLQGNALFAEGKHQEALGKYALSLSYMDEDFLMQLEGMYLDKAHEVKVPVHLNMAACQLHIGDQHTAIYNCTEALTMDPGNPKALYRRARAKHQLGQTQGAEDDLKAALTKVPEDRAILKELHAVRSTMAQERQAQARLFKGTLPAAAAPSQPSPCASVAAAAGSGATAGGREQRQSAGASAAGSGSGDGSSSSLLQQMLAWLSGILVAWLKTFQRPKLHQS